MVLIYKITCSANGKVYIGLTARTLRERWIEHTKESVYRRIKRPLYHAMRKHGLDAFTIEEVERFDDEDAAALRERELIESHGARAPAGFNLSGGGEMVPGGQHSPETKEKLRRIFAGRTFSPETIEKMRLAAVNRSDETRAKMSAAAKRRERRPFTPETVAKLKAARARQPPVSEETRAKISAAGRGRVPTDEARANMSKAGKGKPKSAAHNAAVSAAKRGWQPSPETIQRMKEGQQRRWARQRETEKTL